MALRPELEARVRAAEERTNAVETRAREVTTALESAVEDGSNAVPEETFDDPSVVRHVEELGQTAQRARRDSRALRRVASGYTVSRPRR